jgi:hypothetical protein
MGRLAAAALLALLLAASPAAAAPYLPPSGKVWHGVASGADVRDFTARTGRAPAVWQHWIQWGGGFGHALERAGASGTRLMLHLSTAPGQNMPGRISPGAIARGAGDGYLLRLNRALAGHGAPVYLRLMAEMNNCDLAYSSHGCDGRARGRDHAPARFRAAWRRSVLVLRGGPVERIDARLRALGLPPVRGAADAELPEPQLAVLWSPMTGGSPMIAALRPERFWPGGGYVDWVSTSFYSRFPNFHFLEPFYRRFAVGQRKPFAFGEYAMWGGDDAGFARRLVGWVRSHPRVRMLVYNQGDKSFGPFRLRRYPRASSVLRGALSSPRFAAVPEELRAG